MGFWNKKAKNVELVVTRTAIITKQDVGGRRSSIHEVERSQSGFGTVRCYHVDAVLMANGKTQFSNLTWMPNNGWSNDDLVMAGFSASVPQTVENMLAIAILRGDATAAKALADRIIEEV